MYDANIMKKSSRFYLKYNPDNRWSFWTGKWWSLCSEISGQFTPKLGGQFDRLFHDNVIKGKTDGEYLKFVTYAPNFITIKNGFARVPFTAKYTTELSFKDNKVKYEIIELEMSSEANYQLNFTGSGISFFIFNKKGELKKEDAKNSIEEYFNANILSLSNFLQGRTVEDKW